MLERKLLKKAQRFLLINEINVVYEDVVQDRLTSTKVDTRNRNIWTLLGLNHPCTHINFGIQPVGKY